MAASWHSPRDYVVPASARRAWFAGGGQLLTLDGRVCYVSGMCQLSRVDPVPLPQAFVSNVFRVEQPQFSPQQPDRRPGFCRPCPRMENVRDAHHLDVSGIQWRDGRRTHWQSVGETTRTVTTCFNSPRPSLCSFLVSFRACHPAAAGRSQLRRSADSGDVGTIYRCSNRIPSARAVTGVPPIGRRRAIR